MEITLKHDVGGSLSLLFNFYSLVMYPMLHIQLFMERLIWKGTILHYVFKGLMGAITFVVSLCTIYNFLKPLTSPCYATNDTSKKCSCLYIDKKHMYSKRCHNWQMPRMEKPRVVIMFICFTIHLCLASSHNVSTYTTCNVIGQWPNQGGGLLNTRHACLQKIDPSTISKLALKWQVNVGLDVTVTPSVSNDGVVYVPSLKGILYAINAKTGNVLWARNLTSFISSEILNKYTNIHQSPKAALIYSRTTPVITKKTLLMGIYGPAILLSLRRDTGDLIWSSVLDQHPYAVLTMSGTVYKSSYFIGVSSSEEGNFNLSECCYFQGKMLKVDIKTGTIQWKTLMLPNNHGNLNLYAGAALWGSSPSIDTMRNLVYIATGNLYSSPPSVQKCEEEQQNKTHRDYPDPCIQLEDHSESILALDLENGTIIWSHHLGAYDTWVEACSGLVPGPKSPNCPQHVGVDADFGEAPMMLTIHHVNGKYSPLHSQDIVVTGQKNGYVWALDRNNGKLVWVTVAGPGGLGGGTMWGAATDGERIYINLINFENNNFTLIPSNVVTTGGGWVAINASNGTILWSVATPDGSVTPGSLSVTNGVVFATSFGKPYGGLFALEATTGKILWQYKTNSSISAGVSIANDCVYLGQGISVSTNSLGLKVRGSLVDAYCLKI
ncbi:unnamed protein product [Sphagnum compactum]